VTATWNLDFGHLSFPADSRSSGACYPRWVLHLTLTGGAVFSHAQGGVTTSAGDILLVRPMVDIAWRVVTPPWEVIWFVFVPPPAMEPWLRFPETRSGYLNYHISDRDTARAVEIQARRAHHHARDTQHPGRIPLTLNAIESALLLCYFDQTAPAAHTPPRDPRVTAALRFLGERLDRPTSVAEVAAAAATSRSRLLAIFRQQMGVPLMAWFEQERMRRAHSLLPYLSVRQVATAVGFSDAKYFSRRFRNHFGLPPHLHLSSHLSGHLAGGGLLRTPR